MTKYFEKWVNRTYESFVTNPFFYTAVYSCTTQRTTVINRRTGKTGTAKCHPNDNPNKKIGIAIAYARCTGKPVPDMDKDYSKK